MTTSPAASQEHLPLLQVEQVSVRRNRTEVIKQVNLEIYPGEFVGIVGPNGGGKSTLIQAILGLLTCQSGRILVAGKPPMSKAVFGKIAWVSQAAANLPHNVRLTVRELVGMGLLNNKNWFIPGASVANKVNDAIRMVGLEHLASRDVNQLSGGERQRAVIARALASGAEFLLLDEPLVGMDRASRSSLLKLLDSFCHEKNKTILMISHDVAAMRQTAHRMVYLEETIRFDGPPPDFPSLEELASLRGIEDVHDGHHYDHSAEHCGGGDHPVSVSVYPPKEAK
jgi:zinc transport system ATP-binding protein